MSGTYDGVTILPEHECWDLAQSMSLGRLVTAVDDRPQIFPVNFAVQHRTVLFRTAEGTKLISVGINNHVVFEVDDHDVAEGWSVIIEGTTHSLHTDEEIQEAKRVQLLPWTASAKKHYIRILPERVTGRRFRFDVPRQEEPARA